MDYQRAWPSLLGRESAIDLYGPLGNRATARQMNGRWRKLLANTVVLVQLYIRIYKRYE